MQLNAMDELQKRAAPPPLSADEERRQRLKAGALALRGLPQVKLWRPSLRARLLGPVAWSEKAEITSL